MSDRRTLKLFVKGNADIVNAVLSKNDGGVRLTSGVRELVAASFPGSSVTVDSEPSHGFGELRRELAAGTTKINTMQPDVVVLSLADDVAALADQPAVTEEVLAALQEDLVAAITAIKELGAHILVANVSTFDPGDATTNYHGLAPEPFALRAHRLDLMLVGVSHTNGISVIDVDRLLAEHGAASVVRRPAHYNAEGCSIIADEVVRILEDYGFFDDRPLVAQVGAGAG